MKRFLSILVLFIFAFLLFPNIHIFAQEENQDSLCEEEKTYLEENDLTPNEILETDDNTIESQIIIGSGKYDHESTIYLNEFASYYFCNLTDNFGYNYIGSCSYTAITI